MPTSTTAIRRVAWLVAVIGVAATVLTLILAFDLTGAPPAVPETADFPTRVLSFQAFEQTRWPIDMVGGLLFAVAFGGIMLLGALLFGRTGRVDLLALLGAGGILGAASQLTHVGAHQVALAIGYCDCGFKTEEIISQSWGLMLIDGVADWLLNGAAVLLALGVIVAGRALGGREMPSAWYTLSWVLAGVLILSVAAAVIGVQGPVGPLLVALVSGVLLPIWAGWLALGLPDRDTTRAA